MEGRGARGVMLGLAEERDRYKGAYESARARIAEREAKWSP